MSITGPTDELGAPGKANRAMEYDAMTNAPVIEESESQVLKAKGDRAGHDFETFKPLSKTQIILRRFFRNKLATLGVIIIVLLTLTMLAVTWFSPYKVTDLDPEIYGASPPSPTHWLGTNNAGADVATLLAHGTLLSLRIGLLVGLISPIVAVIYGTSMAYFGGKVESFMLFVLETLIMMPAFLMIAIMMSGRSYDWKVLVFMLVIFGWMGTARVIRGMAKALVNLDYVKAARYMGVSSPKIILRHLAPNIASLTVLNITTGIWGAILAEVSYSFIGIGIHPPNTSLGLMIQNAADSMSVYPWLFWSPVITLALIIGPMALINDGLRDALDPTSAAGGKA